jgi:hypothetical protein
MNNVSFLKVGHRVISLRHLVLSEDADMEPLPKSLPPGVLRIVVETGRTIDLSGEDADTFRDYVRRYAISRETRRVIVQGESIEPEAGLSEPGPG